MNEELLENHNILIDAENKVDEYFRQIIELEKEIESLERQED